MGFFVYYQNTLTFLGLPSIEKPISQKILFSYEKILFRLLESVGYTVSCFTDCGIVRPSFLRWWDVYYRQTHVCSLSTCDVSEVLGSFSHVQKNRTYYHHDNRNGKTLRQTCLPLFSDSQILNITNYTGLLIT